MNQPLLGIIDAQRGFMPATEGSRLGVHGFGELPVPEGQAIIAPLNRVIGAFAVNSYDIFTTQDWHPRHTAHFSETPNFATDWPVHCVKGTPGAELHPELRLPATHERFIKGFEPLEHGEDDTSYSGQYAESATTGLSLPEWLGRHEPRMIYLGGLALDYCVGKTAIDLRVKDGFDVTVILDASRGIASDSTSAMLQSFENLGIATITSEALLEEL